MYYYAAFDSGMMVIGSGGNFKTTQTNPHSFRFAFGSCSTSGNHPIYHVIDSMHPDLMLVTGDLHYYDPSGTDVNSHRYPYAVTINQPSISLLLSHTPIAYVWDDHDFTCNNCDGTSPGKHAAYAAYQQIVPHYPLADTGIDVAIYQSFQRGRVRFIMSDTRSERINGIQIMTQQQLDWLKHEFLLAKQQHQLAIWVSSVSFTGSNQTDNWAEFTAQRAELANFWRDSAIANILILSGDAHMLAIDNGSNNHYETDSINPHQYPIFQAAALNRSGSIKGGTFSEGVFPNPTYYTGQFGWVDIIDNGGDSICLNLTGYRVDSAGTATNTILNYSFCRNLVQDLITNEPSQTPSTQLFSTQVIAHELQVANLLSDSSITIDVYDASGKVVCQQLKIQARNIAPVHLSNEHGMLLIKASSYRHTETRKVSY